ncbi:MAG TPA: hypothetical protein VG709_05890 [Actinomycetota bacterium]|nr:hypothetical protein [Actinomycetota bacterium]
MRRSSRRSSPRRAGTRRQRAGVKAVGYTQTDRVESAADRAGFEVASPMALALTTRRLLSFAVSNPIGMGIGLKVEGLLGSVPISAVDAIDVGWLLIGSRLTVTVRGTPVKLEGGPGAPTRRFARDFADLEAGLRSSTA